MSYWNAAFTPPVARAATRLVRYSMDCTDSCAPYADVAGAWLLWDDAAPLIVVASELLATLKAVYERDHGRGAGLLCTEDAMRELIARAEGRTA